ncbi:type 3 dihydrofolate reductase [Thiosulfativibrio zosterae]|uniref:Dihydrofolate reductase n=1 Tax=Thiosulfativibrio zosterae TaxID=2675053 RepID=A0A6F8PLF2_9GAMM|nr:type 3 dihydrofolate reductase [Thiosulfativibrio zosterae]BBP42916.1 dihydrofolate reductase [Thiosulfativibrio zosterae]
MMISMIAAMDKNRVIGADNTMPWHLPDDLKFFKAKTLGKTVIMGRKTFESIGSKPLPGRRNCVISRNTAWQPVGVEVFSSVDAAINSCADEAEVVIMGGGQLYAQMLPLAHKLYITQIEAEVTGDTVFPVWESSEWQEIERAFHPQDERHAYAFSFITLQRN